MLNHTLHVTSGPAIFEGFDMSQIGRFLLSAVLVLASFTPLRAQVGTQASILGEVRDASAGALPGAEINVTNLATGLTQTSIAGGDGSFEILALPIGWYSVTVSMPGFKTWKVDKVELTVGDRRRVSPVLEVGAVTEQVSVEGGSSLGKKKLAIFMDHDADGQPLYQ